MASCKLNCKYSKVLIKFFAPQMQHLIEGSAYLRGVFIYKSDATQNVFHLYERITVSNRSVFSLVSLLNQISLSSYTTTLF